MGRAYDLVTVNIMNLGAMTYSFQMQLLVSLLILTTALADEREDFLERYKRSLHEAAANVVRMSKPPEFNMPSDFMRSFVPNTGVGNREELIIENIKEIPVFYDANLTRWQYERFKNTDYVLGSSDRLVVLNKMSSMESFFVFSKDEAIFTFVPYKSIVTDTIIFTRLIKRSVALYVAILTQSAKTNLIYVYEIYGNKGQMIGMISLDLGSNGLVASRISYVQSQYGGSLVVLINTKDVYEITYKQQGSTEILHFIEVRYPSAVDMISYRIHGNGYIAVTNSSTCEVLKMDQFARSHISFDSIHSPHKDILDLEYFRLGFHHYLIIGGKNNQYLYVWKNGEYSLKQSFDRLNIKQIYSSTLPSCRDDVLLFFIGDESVGIHVYSGKNEVFIESDVSIPQNFSINPRSVTSFSQHNKAVIFFLNKAWNLMACIIETRLESVPNPILVEGKEISKYMESIQETLREQSRQVEYIKDVLQHAVRKTGTQTFTSFQSFDELHSSDETVVESIKNTVFVEWDGSDLTLDQYKKGTELLEKDVLELEKLVEDIEKVIPDIVRVDEAAEITGTKHFVGDIRGSSISAYSVDLQSAGGVNLPKLQREVYRLDKPQKIEGTLNFEKPLTITGNLDVETTVNGIDISEDVMTTNTQQTSHAEMSFVNKVEVKGNLDISGTLNGIKVRDEVVTLSGTHVIEGSKTFQGGLIADSITTKLIDGVDIEDLFETALSKSKSKEISGTKTFSGGLLTNDIILHGKVNGYDINELEKNIVRIDKPAYIAGHLEFSDDVIINSTLAVEGKLNGLRIPDDLFLTDIAQDITGHKEFTGVVFAKDIEVAGKVDGLRIPEDIVTLSGDEEIPSTLFFTDGIDVQNDIIVEGLVDGVDISDLAKEALKLNETSQFENAIFLGPVNITGNLQVNGLVNDVKLDELVKDIVFKDEKDIVIESEKHFKKIMADTVKLDGVLNGFNLDVDFMKVHGDQIINGTKTFKQPVTFENLDIANGMIGDLNITHLYENRLSLIIEDKVERDFEFTDEVIVDGNLIVHGTVGGLRIPEDVVLRNSPGPIFNKVFKNKVKVVNLVVNGDVQVSGSFGGINLEEFYKDRIKLHGDQEIEGDLFIGDSEITSVELSGTINNVDFVSFANNVMSKTKDQTITAPKTFLGTTKVYGKITTQAGVNGYDLANLNKRAFKLYENNIVNGLYEFKDITVKDITMGGFINGVNITELSKNSLKKKGLQYVTGTTTFEQGFHVEGDINADRVNDLVIPDDILLKSFPQTITGQLTLGKLEVGGDLNVEGFVNGLNLAEIAPQLARIDETVLVSNVTFIGPIRVINDITVSGLVNGVDLKNLAENVLLKNGHQTIKGHKTLRGNVTIKGNLEVGTVNGVDWATFLADIVRINEPQVIKGPKTFLNGAEAEEVYSDLTNVNLVNGVSLQKLLEDAVFIDIPSNITGTKVFKRPVEISGDMTAKLINGLDLKTDVITLVCNRDGPQVITGQKTFTKITADADIEVGGTVNSYNLFDLYKDTLLTEGTQTIQGSKRLTKEAIFMKNINPGTVNGLKLRENLITLDTEQEIDGPVIFAGNIFIEKDIFVEGLINDVDLFQLANDAIYLDKKQTIDGLFHFNKVTTPTDVIVAGTVNGLDLVAFQKNVTDFWKEASDALVDIDKQSQDNCELLQYIQNVLANSIYILNGFFRYQDLKYPSTYFQVKTSSEIALVTLDEFDGAAIAVSSVWDSVTKSFTSTGAAFQTTIAETIVQNIGITKITINIGIFEKDSHVLINNKLTSLPSGFKGASIVVRNQNEVVIGFLFPAKGECELYKLIKLNSTNIEIESYSNLTVGKETTSIAIFDVRDTLYLAVSRHYTPPYFRGFCKIFGEVHDGWQRIQSISLAASTTVKHFKYHGYHYLAFTNIAPYHETREPKSLQLYRNSGPNELFFTLFQKFPFENAKGIDVFEFGDLSELYLTTWNETTIKVLRLEGESGLKSASVLHGRCIKTVKALLIEDDIYLAVGQQNLETDEVVNSVLYKGLIKGTKFTPHKFIYC